MNWSKSRKNPYTEAGIRRCNCVRCGEKATYQWQICADGNNYRPLCDTCDVLLNIMVLDWAKHPRAEELSRKYAEMHGFIPPSSDELGNRPDGQS